MESKACSACHFTKPTKEFPFRNKAKGKRHGKCSACIASQKKVWYAQSAHRSKAKGYALKQKNILKEHLFEYLSTHPCTDCGNSNPLVLDFDHDNPTMKTFSIGNSIRSSKSWTTVLKEIDKCVVRCANCHRIRTAKQFSTYKFRLQASR